MNYNEDTLKKLLFSIWDKKGYATSDPSFLKLFNIPLNSQYIAEELVLEWNELNDTDVFKYFNDEFNVQKREPFGHHFNEYYELEPKSNGYIRISNSDGLKSDVKLHSVDIDLERQNIVAYIEFDSSRTYPPNQNNLSFDEIYPYDDDEDEDEWDEWHEYYNEYREDVRWAFEKYFFKKYVSKTGYAFDVEFV